MTTAYSSAQSKRSTSLVDRLNTKQAKLLLLVTALFFVVLYVYQTSVLATRTFAINELEGQLRSLEQEQRSMDVQIAEHRSLQNIEARLADSNYVATTEIAYISGAGTAVASR